MQNLKIRVNSADESKEAQELFLGLGYVRDNWLWSGYSDYPIELRTREGGYSDFNLNAGNAIDRQEITLPELRAMVNPMKEYLVPDNGGYRVAVQDASLPIAEDWIAIPDNVNFAHMDDTGVYFTDTKDDEIPLIWQRATHPEELPFVGDEPRSLNDQYAEIEQVRQHNHYFKDVSGLNEIDVYMVLKLFNVTDPCLQHIAKKALCAGQRGHKNFNRDLKDILDTAKRAVEINNG